MSKDHPRSRLSRISRRTPRRTPRRISRRNFLKGMLSALVGPTLLSSQKTFAFLQALTSKAQTEPPIFSEVDRVRFAVIGDFGDNSRNEAEVAEMVKSLNPDLIITVGDNNYPVGSSETIDENVGKYYHEYIGNYKGTYGAGSEINRFFPSLGNHDWDSPEEIQPYLDYFTLPGNERYYDFIWGPVHFFAVDNDHHEPDGIEEDSIQALWLKDALARSTMPWKIVYMHHPPYTSGDRREPNPARAWPFAAWGATAVLTGHDHLYERLHVDGIPYFVNGVGGADVYGYGEISPESVFRYNASHGAMLVEATRDNIHFEFLSATGHPAAYLNEKIFAGEWVELDLTNQIEDNRIQSFVVDGTYPSSVFFATREVGIPPQLMLYVAGAAEPVVLSPIHETYVKSERPESNYNDEHQIRLRLTDEEHYRGYVKYEIPDFDAPIERVTIRLYMKDGSGDDGGLAIYRTSNNLLGTAEPWTEDTLTWENAPLRMAESRPIDTHTITLEAAQSAVQRYFARAGD